MFCVGGLAVVVFVHLFYMLLQHSAEETDSDTHHLPLWRLPFLAPGMHSFVQSWTPATATCMGISTHRMDAATEPLAVVAFLLLMAMHHCYEATMIVLIDPRLESTCPLSS